MQLTPTELEIYGPPHHLFTVEMLVLALVVIGGILTYFYVRSRRKVKLNVKL